MATKKGGGSTSNGRDSNGQRRGVKTYEGETIHAGTIIVRQVGSRIHPGLNVGVGRDWTLYSKINGVVKFNLSGSKRSVSVLPQ